MRLFVCGSCGNTVYFDNDFCVRCGASLGFVPESMTMLAVKDDGSVVLNDQRWLRCNNHDHGCNWVVAGGDGTPFCVSCRLNRTIPDLSQSQHKALWQRLEEDKRRLIYSALRLHLPLVPQSQDADGLAFDFLADATSNQDPTARVLSGHVNGVITLNIAEADPVAREQMRVQMGEPYRTILGHFRHESGHYYWDYLTSYQGEIDEFRRLFGDERVDYAESLRRYYQQGPPTQWRESFISAYASAHPWEDWAETWSHYLHMIDALEVAWSYGLTLDPRHAGSDWQPTIIDTDPYLPADFSLLIGQWLPLTVTLNSLNRSIGHEPAYPFTVATAVLEKLQFVHRLLHQPRSV